MNLKLKSIADKGDLPNERLVISVLKDSNIGEFAVFRTGLVNGEIQIGVTNTYWFPDKQLKAGDLVVLYSKTGKISEKKLERGNMAYFYYWGQSQALWKTSEKAAVLLHAPAWEASGANEL